MLFFSPHKSRVIRATCRRPSAFRPRLEALEDRCLLSAGVLDPTFGSGGIVDTGPSGQAFAVALQTDGKIVVAGPPASGGSAGTVARYTTTGALDTSFGSGGTAAVSFFKNQYTQLLAVALDSSGRIVLAGNAYSPKGQDYIGLARLTSTGSLDGSFGNKGEVLIPLSGSELHAVVIQPNGQIVVAGYAGNYALLARYNANGRPDSSFGSGGMVETTLGATEALFSSLTLQGDGKMVAGGEEWPTSADSGVLFAVARFNANGSLDSSFGSGGQISTSIAGNCNAVQDTGVHAVLVQGNGMIMAAGAVKIGAAWNSNYEVALARYDSSGNLDPAFGSGGVALNPSSGNASDVAFAAALQSDGKIVTAGYHNDATGTFVELERYTTAGALDTTFNGTGMVTTGIAGDGARAIAIYPSTDTSGNAGKIVGVGSASNARSQTLLVARYLPSEPQIGSFTASANPVTAGGSVTLTASNITDGNPNSTITQVAFYVQINGNNTLLGYGTQTGPGVWTLTFTVNLAPGTYTLFAQAEDSYGVFGDPLALTLTVQ
jgi:uncharacterized delta-60 repeat protein